MKWNSVTPVFRILRIFVLFGLLLVVFQVIIDPGSNPFYVGNRNGARSASCQSNLKQIGLALLQYSQDYDSTLPSSTTAEGHGWREAVYPYVKSFGVYRCPDDNRGGNHDSEANLPKSYSANAAVLGRKEALDKPLTILAVDTRGFEGEDWSITSPAFLPATGRELYLHHPRHLIFTHVPGITNFLLADGHGKAMKPNATLAPVNLWTLDNQPFVGQDLLNAQAILTHAEAE